jgi:hypothetical protein
MNITFFNDIVFDTSQLIQFIRRTPTTLRAFNEVRFTCGIDIARAHLSSNSSPTSGIVLTISCREPVSSLEQAWTSRLPPIPTLEDLYFYEALSSPSDLRDDVENTRWLDLLHPFTTVKNLYLSKKVAPRIVPALQELVGGRTTEVLPTLQKIFLEELQPSGPVWEGVERFVAARQVADHSIALSRWDNPELSWWLPL